MYRARREIRHGDQIRPSVALAREQDEVVRLRVCTSNVQRFLSGAAAAVHEKDDAGAGFDLIGSIIPDGDRID